MGSKPMFMGEYQHTIDDKNRLIIPSKFREGLGDKFVMTKGLDNCLFVYPIEEWEKLEQKLKASPFTKSEARAFVRYFYSGPTECEHDKQGRVLVPQVLKDHAQIKKDVVIIGVSSRVEVWSKEVWERYSQEAQQDYEAIAENLTDLNFNL